MSEKEESNQANVRCHLFSCPEPRRMSFVFGAMLGTLLPFVCVVAIGLLVLRIQRPAAIEQCASALALSDSSSVRQMLEASEDACGVCEHTVYADIDVTSNEWSSVLRTLDEHTQRMELLAKYVLAHDTGMGLALKAVEANSRNIDALIGMVSAVQTNVMLVQSNVAAYVSDKRKR